MGWLAAAERKASARAVVGIKNVARVTVRVASAATRRAPALVRKCSAAGACQMPADDPACGAITCPADSICRDYATSLSSNRCKAFGQCKTAADCAIRQCAGRPVLWIRAGHDRNSVGSVRRGGQLPRSLREMRRRWSVCRFRHELLRRSGLRAQVPSDELPPGARTILLRREGGLRTGIRLLSFLTPSPRRRVEVHAGGELCVQRALQLPARLQSGDNAQ